MPFGALHDFLEQVSPKGVGFGLHNTYVAKLIKDSVDTINKVPAFHLDLSLIVTDRVNFSFNIDPASVKVTKDWGFSLNLEVWLHPPGQPNNRIVTVKYEIQDAEVEADFDGGSGQCFWKPAPKAKLNKVAEDWEPTGQFLIAIGYEVNGAPDFDGFKNEIFYGFIWINAAQLLPTIFRAIPFPQFQQFFGPFRLKPPFNFAKNFDYFAIWSNDIDIIDLLCGTGPKDPEPALASWDVLPHSGAKSPYEYGAPRAAMYVAAKNIVDWHATYLAPAIAFSDSGGGFIKYSVDATLSLRSLKISLQPTPQGGDILLDAGLRVAAYADSWIDGPCGAKLSLAHAAITANASAHADFKFRFDLALIAIMLDLDITADLDRNSVDITSGGLLGGVFGELVEILYKSGIINVDTEYRKRAAIELLRLRKDPPPPLKPYKVMRRVGELSAMFAYYDGEKVPDVG